jgi:hypothetical protein
VDEIVKLPKGLGTSVGSPGKAGGSSTTGGIDGTSVGNTDGAQGEDKSSGKVDPDSPSASGSGSSGSVGKKEQDLWVYEHLR